MTRILVQRGSGGSSSASSSSTSSSSSSSSSSNQSRNTSASSSVPSFSSPVPPPVQTQIGNDNQATLTIKEDELAVEAQEHVTEESLEFSGDLDCKGLKDDVLSPESVSSFQNDAIDTLSPHELLDVNDYMGSGDSGKSLGELSVVEEENESLVGSSVQIVTGTSYPPPPPVPPPRPSTVNSIPRRPMLSGSNAIRTGSSRRASGWPNMAVRTSPSGSRPSSPRSHCENDGYNSSDEQNICFGPSYDDMERERQFENDIRRAKGLEVKKMLEDGNCLFRAVADQVYGDSEAYDLVRQMCIDYMERERDHFAQFITEGFTSYCKRKRRDKVYGNNVEIQAMSEMYNRPIHIYSYSTEPINIFHGSYTTDTPPVRLSFHHGNHYNSLVDPRRLTVGAGLGFSSLRGTNVDKDQVKAAIRAQQEQQIDNALLAEGRYYSDLELTEKEMERMVMEASRFEYLANDRFKHQLGHRESSTSRAEPSSSGARSSSMISEPKKGGGGGGGGGGREQHSTSSRTADDDESAASVLSSSMQIVMSMGFSYVKVIEAYSIFGDDVDSMVCYLLETSDSSRRKGKATE